MEEKMSLILDHINGNNKDNRLENLQIVYPNCDAALSTFKGRNRKDKKIIIDYKTPKKYKNGRKL